MRKITHLGITTSLMLLSTQAFSADTLAKAFEEGKISGEIKSQYFQKEVADKKVSIWTNGGNLSYVTGDFYGFNAGITVQADSDNILLPEKCGRQALNCNIISGSPAFHHTETVAL